MEELSDASLFAVAWWSPVHRQVVKVTGHVYSRGGSDAISLEQIEEVKD